ncbi:hypothetical protein Afil01_22330 [Actinorhabdospora filicis]|uniref:Uncharacterized protein n=1 Tax=Actinorhabdospora filicis TaxID=1785913 RepID=A0A9W6SMR0_9ACTN|nr:hypothetical protein [Actinorhabdospora filicis]GLZ77426.1 hypothetical protein Afil01_22330 [Actinorhabdospora filicis]
MTDFIRDALDRQLDAAAPPSGLTSGGLTHLGRRRVLRKRLGLTGVTAVLLAAAVTGGLALAPGTPDPGVHAATTTQADYPLPVPQPGVEYRWQPGNSDITENQATRELSAALWPLIDAVPNATPVAYDSNGQVVGAPLTASTFPSFTRRTDRIDADGVPTGYERPVYTQFHWLKFDGMIRPDVFSVSYRPKGSYEFGGASDPDNPTMPDWRHVAESCGHMEYAFRGEPGWVSDTTCAELTGPGGERIMTMGQTTVAPGGITSYSRSVMIQTPDGNLRLVQDFGPTPTVYGSDTPDIADPRPGLSLERLTELALALPAVILQ